MLKQSMNRHGRMHQPLMGHPGAVGLSTRSTRQPREATTHQPQTWQARAIDTYRRAEAEDIHAMQIELAWRIRELTNETVAPSSVYVNRDERMALVTVDGVMFRLTGRDLVVLRPCAGCGLGQLESPVIRSALDLGHALSAWEPRCPHCEPEDPSDWMERDD